ncbi:MAG TPA: hybrid sensor histidine kinase/response regulator [Acidobacteriota bacterium]|nr:hybrid sensor histidine kinase/response regulator [Acidobacteriota bacterium]
MDILHILVVDDEFGMRQGAERALRDFVLDLPDINGEVRFSVKTAANGKELEEKLESGRTDILLLDHKLPDITGLEILDRLNRPSLDLLTIMITAYASLETAVAATRRGAYDFLAKPFTPEELRGAVRKAARHLILQRKARRLAEEKRQVRFQFTSVLAHEMKAPLAAIEGYLQMIRERAVGESLASYDRMLDRCLLRTDGMRKLIADLLDLTAIESGQRQRSLSIVDLAEVARQAVENVKIEAQQRDIRIDIDVAEGFKLEADRTEMDIILNNLLSNAVKYNRDHGRVRVAAGAAADAIRIQVEDTGIGMTPEESKRLFNDFSRIKNERTRHILGSGLGLSTVKKLATLYGGEVTVKSKPDVGSTFTVTIKRK